MGLSGNRLHRKGFLKSEDVLKGELRLPGKMVPKRYKTFHGKPKVLSGFLGCEAEASRKERLRWLENHLKAHQVKDPKTEKRWFCCWSHHPGINGGKSKGGRAVYAETKEGLFEAILTRENTRSLDLRAFAHV